MNRRHGIRRGLALTVTIGLLGSLAAAPAAAGGGSTGQVEWGACPDPIAAAAPTVRCGTVTVPLDYRDPDGTRIDLMVSRIPSTNPEKRRGVLLLNPGGPGGSALTMPHDLVNLGVPASVTDAYDLIGMDPRGVGYSARIDCGFTTDQGYPGNVPPWAEDDAAVLAQAAAARAVAEQCAAHDTDGRMAHISTANTARDLDRIRAALGERKASFLGYSYGSALGAAYASMFPDTTDRVIIDSNAGDTALTRAGVRRFGLGFEQAFPDFARWAAARHASYGLGRTPEQVRATYFALAERLDEQPLPFMNGREFRVNTFASLYGESQYPALARAWQEVKGAGAVTAGARAAAAPSPYSNFFTVFLAVTCNDSDWPSNVGGYRRSVAEDREKYPMFGAASANINPCAFWSLGPAEPQVAVNDDGPANILILQNRRDAGTPLRGGQLIRAKFAHRSRLVTVDENQHGVYVFDDNPCALGVGTAWLVDGVLPPDTTCAASARSGLNLDRDGEQRRAETLRTRPLGTVTTN
ncbi:alpha/beta fold hydrolase [Jidongwangia harbinensis]|uniref:alpha/beta fold hydrolase n=1 Tax=Jidongwangia harbinensis TaxID=2878561 RepID=UPI001CD9CDE2|nr:alpha/beta fold hydrolase [Jidongwangia harbinensis]MCA2211668.1 alpha/beta hydrolase [Jidongwangia harbinensis]